MISRTNYRLGISCCFCGSNIDIDEASRTTTCSHCGSTLRIERGTSTQVYYVSDSLKRREIRFLVDRHLKKNNRPLSSGWGETRRVFVPYWRVRGTCISVREETRRFSITEVDEYGTGHTEEAPKSQARISPKEITLCADETRDWGLESLGVRSQTLSLIPATVEFREKNHILPITISVDDAKKRLHSAVDSIALAVSSGSTDITDYIVNIQATLIYFPLWVARMSTHEGKYTVQFDPFAKRIVSVTEGEFEIPESDGGENINDLSMKVLPHRCPNCGDDLPAGGMSCAHYCRNCGRLYSESTGGFKNVELRIPRECDDNQRLFPFWMFDIAGSSWPEKESFMQALKLLRFRNDQFMFPAFGISNPSKLLRLVVYYNRRHDYFEFENRLPTRYTFIDVMIQSEQAASMIAPLMSAIKSMEGYRVYEGKINGTPKLAEPVLVWLPFSLDRYFWREQITGATIEKAAVRI